MCSAKIVAGTMANLGAEKLKSVPLRRLEKRKPFSRENGFLVASLTILGATGYIAGDDAGSVAGAPQ